MTFYPPRNGRKHDGLTRYVCQMNRLVAFSNFGFGVKMCDFHKIAFFPVSDHITVSYDCFKTF